jgi:broad specificity phosphatase PhoE
VAATQVHLVRHGEVHNPDGILYGRLPGFRLSEIGVRMAALAAADLVARGRRVALLAASPLQRAQESAAPIAEAFGLSIGTDARLIEPTNRFEGSVMSRQLRNPLNWPRLINPLRPSWGEPYRSIALRMHAALDAAFDAASASPGSVDPDAATGSEHEGGDAVLVGHQLPIWVAHLDVTGERFMHDPRRRRCALSSITTFERHDGRIVEVGYTEPAASLQSIARDVGAV